MSHAEIKIRQALIKLADEFPDMSCMHNSNRATKDCCSDVAFTFLKPSRRQQNRPWQKESKVHDNCYKRLTDLLAFP